MPRFFVPAFCGGLVALFGLSLMAAGHPWGEEKLTPKEIASYYDSAFLAGEWYLNTQNTAENPWGGIHDSADLGRFIYEYFPARRWARGNVVWGQAVGIMGLLGLHQRTGRRQYLDAALRAAEYMKSLQILDPRDPDLGAMREKTPQEKEILRRDTATGGMGLAALYRHTGDKEYLYRARLLADWYLKTHQPWANVPREKRQVFQVGAGLMYYYVYKLTAEKRYLDGLVAICEPLADDYHVRPWGPQSRQGPETLDEQLGANDDFASIALLAAYRATGDRKYFDAVERHADWLVSVQAEDGSFPGFSAAVYVAGMTMLELCRVIELEKLATDTVPFYRAVHRGARFGLSLQERQPYDRMTYGGFWGQTNFGLNKDRIHHRVTGYSLIFNLRYEGRLDAPYYSTFGWDGKAR